MTIASLIGSTAAICTTVAYLPQVIKTVRTKETKDLSTVFLCVTLFGVFCWLVYGLLINDWPLIAANAVTFVLAAIVFGYKLKFG